ncbi:MAG: hypothetical protein AB7N24_17805 [Dehalococcoidia bacterium]
MVDEGHDSEDFLLGRLNEAASGDTALRQLRRRYDLLRHDYEELLDRLGELETRLDESQKAQSTSPSAISVTIAEAIAAPLLRLRDDYLAAVTGLQGVVTGLEGLASGFKGQHAPPRPAEARATPAPGTPQPEQTTESRGPIRKMQVDVKGSGFGELLDFQERLSEMNGVSRVSISAIDSDRATLVVELEQQ